MPETRMDLVGRPVSEFNVANGNGLIIEKAIDITRDCLVEAQEKVLVLYVQSVTKKTDPMLVFFLHTLPPIEEQNQHEPDSFVLPLGRVGMLTAFGVKILRQYAKRYNIEFGEIVHLIKHHAPDAPMPLYS